MNIWNKSVIGLLVMAILIFSGGCATEMVGQCAMKSVSGDPAYAVGCGAAMAVTAAAVVATGAVAAKQKLEQYQQSSVQETVGPTHGETSCNGQTACLPTN